MFDELFAKVGTRDAFFLDSATPERTRFSYMGGVGGPMWRRVSYVLHDGIPGGVLTIVDRMGTAVVEEVPCVFSWITEQTTGFSFDETLGSRVPFEFWGGLVGYLGYELKCQTGGRQAHRSPNCDACFFIADRFVCMDHDGGDVYLVAVYDRDRRDHGAEAAAWVADVAGACRRLGAAPCHHVGPPASSCHHHCPASPSDHHRTNNHVDLATSSHRTYRLPPLSAFSERHPEAAYKALVERCQASLHAGDSYELCLTNMLRSTRAPDHAGPWDVYKRLRQLNPAPCVLYCFALHFFVCEPQRARLRELGRSLTHTSHSSRSSLFLQICCIS